MTFLYILIILSALYGLFVTLRIRKEKKKDGPMVCPLGADCHTVVNSKFSTFFGIGLELFGALYYIVIAIGYGVYLGIIIAGIEISAWYLFILFGMSMVGFLFSIYLTIVQAFYLKSWCTWCLCSAAASTLIFIISIAAIVTGGVTFVPILELLYKPLIIVHLLGFALGVGGATITDILFYRFLKDFRISKEEDKILKVMSQVIWFGLLLAVISGLGLYIQNAEVLNESSKFLVKVIVIAVIAINGALLNLIVAPKLTDIPFKNTDLMKNMINITSTMRLRKLAFALGSISFVSWYTAFILGSLESVAMTFSELLTLYIAVLAIAIIISQFAEKLFTSKK